MSAAQKIEKLGAKIIRAMQGVLTGLPNNDTYLSFDERLKQKRQNDLSGHRSLTAEKNRVSRQVRSQDRFEEVMVDAAEQFALSAAQQVRLLVLVFFAYSYAFVHGVLRRYHMRSPFVFDVQDLLEDTFKALQAKRIKKDKTILAATKDKTDALAVLRAQKNKRAAQLALDRLENEKADEAAEAAKRYYESKDFEPPVLQRRTSSRLSAPSPATVLRRADSEPGDSQQSVGSVRKAASIDSSQVKRRKRVVVEESTQELDEGSDVDSDEEEEESQASLTKLMRKSKMASQDSQDLD